MAKKKKENTDLIPVSNQLKAVGKTLAITNKLLAEADRPKVPADDFFIPIPDDEFRRRLEEQMDIPVHNGGVYYKDIKEVEEVNFSNETDYKDPDYKGPKIGSLQGIEYFTRLISLNCRANQLTKIDVSKNLELYYLNCFDKQLTELDVSKNLDLKALDC